MKERTIPQLKTIIRYNKLTQTRTRIKEFQTKKKKEYVHIKTAFNICKRSGKKNLHMLSSAKKKVSVENYATNVIYD